jgi:hypothetical protein
MKDEITRKAKEFEEKRTKAKTERQLQIMHPKSRKKDFVLVGGEAILLSKK